MWRNDVTNVVDSDGCFNAPSFLWNTNVTQWVYLILKATSPPDGFIGNPIWCSHWADTRTKEKIAFAQCRLTVIWFHHFLRTVLCTIILCTVFHGRQPSPSEFHSIDKQWSHWPVLMFSVRVRSFTWGIIFTCTIFHHPTRANVNALPISMHPYDCVGNAKLCTARPQMHTQMGITFVYISHMCWKLVAYQNVTPGFTRNICTKETGLLLNRQFSDSDIFVVGWGRIFLFSYAERNLIDKEVSYRYVTKTM